jgi:signal transduction histidine kinase
VIDRELFLGYRLWVVRLGIVLAWLGFAGMLWWGVSQQDSEGVILWGAPIGFLAGLIVVSVLPWKTYLLTWYGDALLITFVVLGIVALGADALLRADDPFTAAYLGAIMFAAAALVTPWGVAVIALLATVGYGVAVAQVGADMTDPAVIFSLLTFALVGVFATAASIGAGVATSGRLAELQRRSRELEVERQELDDLYAISRTIGIGTNLSDVMPALTGRLADAVGGRVGLVFLFSPDDSSLELLSPVWVANRTIPAEGYRLSLNEAGKIQRVMITATGFVDNELKAEDESDVFLTDLDIGSVAAVPLRIEQRSIGVLVVGDKRDGDFTEADLSRLDALAAPASLVLNQLARFEKLQETSLRMSEIAKLKTDFVSVVSHELRTPLTSIIGALGTMRRPELAPSQPAALQMLESADRQAHHLKDLIEDLLMVSRLDDQALPVRVELIQLADAIVDAIQAIPEASNRVAVDLAHDTPLVETDPEHLRRILTNLIVNAINYGGQNPIEVVAEPIRGRVRISVVDHGQGIPFEKTEQLFQRFTQLDRPDTRSVGGTGLGLSIVKGLTDSLGGRVWYEPTVGGGATFTVELPVNARYRQPESMPEVRRVQPAQEPSPG